MSAPLADWSCHVSKGDPARYDRAIAGVRSPARRQTASDLEAHRAGRQQLGADADAHHDLCRLPAARCDLCTRRRRHQRHGQRRGDVDLPAQAGRGRPIYYVGLHRISGAGRCRPAQGLSRRDALDRDGVSRTVRRDPRQYPRLRRPQSHHRRRRHRGHRLCIDAGLDPGRSQDRRDDPAWARI